MGKRSIRASLLAITVDKASLGRVKVAGTQVGKTGCGIGALTVIGIGVIRATGKNGQLPKVVVVVVGGVTG
jgi:hypothetical protein